METRRRACCLQLAGPPEGPARAVRRSLTMSVDLSGGLPTRATMPGPSAQDRQLQASPSSRWALKVDVMDRCDCN